MISLLAIERGLMPGTVNSAALDPGFGPQIRLAPAHGEVRYALSNSFGFGGNNCALVFGKAAAAMSTMPTITHRRPGAAAMSGRSFDWRSRATQRATSNKLRSARPSARPPRRS